MTNNSTPNKNSEETPISLGGCGPEISKTDEDSNSNSNSNTSHRRDDQPGPPLGHRLGITKASSQQLQKPSHPKFQYLSKIPSTTSTTGEDTPPHDNTSSPTEYNGKTYIEADENKEEDLDLPEKIHRGVAASIQIDLKRNLRTQQTHQQAIRPLFGASDHCIKGRDYYYDKYAPQKTNKLALGNHHEDATVDDDAQSSCSTLTTTRSMLLQQDECAITVSSLSVAKKETCDVGVAKAFPCRETGLAKREKPIRMGAKGNGREIANKNDNRKESSPPISLVSTGASSKSAPNPPEEAAEWNDESTKYRDVNIQSRGGRTPTQRPALAGRADSLNLDPKEMVGTTKESKVPVIQFRKEHQFACRGEDFIAVRAQLRKTFTTATVKPEEGRIDFFPLQKPTTPGKKAPTRPERKNPAAARLGVTSRFPSLQIEIPSVDSEGSWDPLHEHKEDEEAWANFGDEIGAQIEDLIPTMSHTSDESPFPFDIMDLEDFKGNDASFAALLDNDQNIGVDEVKQDTFLQISGKAQGQKKTRDTRKALSNGQQRRPPRRDKLQKPKLLGPLLEARFTRSYWRRLKHGNKDYNISKKGGRLVPTSNHSSERSESITDPGGVLLGNNISDDGIFPEVDEPWWEPDDTGSSLFADNAIETKFDVFEGKPNQDDGAMSAPATTTARILSSHRIRECEMVLGTISLSLDDILTAIDAADASFGLTEDQIASLQSLTPTPAEKASLLKPPLDLSLSEGEEFMMQMVGIPELEKKLEVLAFQNQFPISMERFCDGM